MTESSPSGRWTVHALWMTGVFTFAGFISYMDRLILGSLIDPIKHDLALSDSQLALLQGAAFALVYIVAGLLFGRIADRLRRRIPLLVAGSLIWCLGTVGCGLAGNFNEMFAARMVVGVGEATLAPAAVSLLAASVPPQRLATAIGAFVMGTIVGGPGAVAISGALLAIFEGHAASLPFVPWRMVLLACGGFGLILPFLFLTLREPLRAETEVGVPLSQVLATFRRHIGVVLPIYLGLALLSIGDFGLLTWSPSLLTRSFSFEAADIALIFCLGVTLAGIIGSLGGGLFLDWIGRKTGMQRHIAIIAILAGLAAVAAAAMATPSQLLVVAGILGWTMASAVAAIGGIAVLQRVLPAHCRGTAMSLVSFFAILIGLGLGPTLIAEVTETIFADPAAVGWSIAIVTVPAALVGAILFLVSRYQMPEEREAR